VGAVGAGAFALAAGVAVCFLAALPGTGFGSGAGALAGFDRGRAFGGGARFGRFRAAAAAALGDRGDAQQGQCCEECAQSASQVYFDGLNLQ